MPAQPIFPMQQTTYGEEPLYRLLDMLFSSGVLGASDLAVAQRGAGANLSVDVGAGAALVPVTSGGKRLTWRTANTNSGTPGAPNTADNWTSTFTSPDATNPRIDRVVAQARDVDVDAVNFSTRDLALRVIAGTPTGGATLANLSGVAALPINTLLLANVRVGAAATQILTADIDTAMYGNGSLATLVRPLAGIGHGAFGGGVSGATGLMSGAKIAEYVVSGSAVATIDFQNIPQSFAHLRLVISGRADPAVGSVQLSMRVNNDSAGDYEYLTPYGSSASAAAYDTAAAATLFSINPKFPAASSGAGVGIVVADFANYALSTLHKAVAWTIKGYDGTNRFAGAGGGRWTSTGAITRIQVFPASGALIAGTRVTLYGFA